MASRMVSSLKPDKMVSTGWRLGGGVRMMLRSRAPIRENWSVRGMGVAVSVNVSTLALRVFSLSLTPTPNFCSSSMTSKPSSLNLTRFPTKACVPTRMLVSPDSTFFSVSVNALPVLNRLM